MKFFIGFPCNWNVNNSGGLQALKKLTDILTDLGHTVYVTGTSFSNKKTIQVTNISQVNLNTTVVIYPEVVVGNPFMAKHVARWMLYHATTPNGYFHFTEPRPGILERLKNGIEETWDDTDEYFYYIEYFKTKKNKDKKILNVFNFRIDEFNDYGLEREGYCHLFLKNNIDQSFVNEYESEHIPVGNWSEIANMFNRKKYFLTYDECTYFLIVAAMCGCIPIILYKEKNENYRKEYPLTKYGVAYGFEEIEYAKETLNLIKPYLKDLENNSLETVKNFVNFWEEKLKNN